MTMRFNFSSSRARRAVFSPLCALAILGSLISGCRAQPPAVVPPSTPLAAGSGFKLEENLGRTWRNEIVTFALSPADLASARAGKTLTGTDGKAAPYQLVAEGANQKIAFAADLDAFETRAYNFREANVQASIDLKIEETGDAIRISNGQTGIALRKKLDAGQGPISGVLQASGNWAGDSLLGGKDAGITNYSAAVTARGPVFAEVLCRAQNADGKSWEMRVRVPTNSPVVLVEENFALQSEAVFSFNFSNNFAPDHVVYRYGKGMPQGWVGTLASSPIAKESAPGDEPAFVLAPWLPWWEREREGNWFALSSENSSDVLAVGALNPGLWVDPSDPKIWTEPRQYSLKQSPDGLKLDFPLRQGKRRWMIASLDKEKGLAGLAEQTAARQANGIGYTQAAILPQKLLIQYGDFPLDVVKDQMAFAASTEQVEHPRLFVNKTQLATWRKNFKPDAAKLEEYRKTPITMYNLDGPISYFLGTGDEELGKHLAEAAITMVQAAVDQYLHQDALVTLGFAPHHQVTNLTAMNLTDAIINTPFVSSEMRKRLQNQIAFLGFTFSRDDFWSPSRAYAANPNMTSTVAAYQTIAGAMIPNHPDSKTWMKRGLDELYKNQLQNWSDENGGWLEAPHYAMVSYDYLLGSFLAAKSAGMPQYLDDPKMKRVAAWFAQISTPPDARLLNRRHFPPIGNTYYHDLSGTFGLVAGIWKDKDPAFASHMQWMYQQQGSDPLISIGGLYPTLVGYRTMLTDATIPAKAPVFTSTLFPKTGVVLRNKYPSDRESYLHMIAGENHAHYDADSGSVVIWGKGRVIADDFGYGASNRGQDHNMISSLAAPDGAAMQVGEFSPGAKMDYVRAKKKSWTRQIALVKGDGASGLEYFVISDNVRGAAPATWRMWLVSDDVKINERGALAVGSEDVDTDIYFAGQLPKLSTEKKASDTYGLDSKGNYGKTTPTMTGLIADAGGTGKASNFNVVMFPRLKTENPPTFSSLADGKVIKVQSGGTTDYVFQSAHPFKFEDEGIKFEGTSGLARVKGGKAEVSLGADGRISALGQSAKKGELKMETGDEANLLENGDFESGEQNVYYVPPPDNILGVTLHEGDPANEKTPGEKHAGRRTLSVQLKQDGGGAIWLQNPLQIDPTRVYRVRLKIYTPDEITLQATSYASDGKDANLKTPEGKIWQYDIIAKGPTPGWSTLETTVGPVGSAAKQQWPPTTREIGVTLYVGGKKGTLYVDDISVEEVAPDKAQ